MNNLLNILFVEHVENEETLAENIEHVGNSQLEQGPVVGMYGRICLNPTMNKPEICQPDIISSFIIINSLSFELLSSSLCIKESFCNK